MFKRNRGNGPAYVVSLVLALTFFGIGLYNQCNEGGPRYDAAQNELSETSVRPFKPAPLANPNPEREEWRAESDLQAQRQMAKWTFGMFIVSGLGVVIGAVGLWALFSTLKLTREANVGFSEASIKQLRPYLVATGVDSTIRNDCWEGMLKIKNFGMSPATTGFLAYRCISRALPDKKDIIADLLSENNSAFDRRVFAPNHEARFGPMRTDIEGTLLFRGGQSFFVVGIIKYQQPGDGRNYVTEFGYEVRAIEEVPIDGEPNTVTVNMVSTEISGFCTVDEDCFAWSELK